MKLFDFFRTPDVNEGVARFHSADDAVLLDVRTRQEYAGGRIPGSRNIPLNRLGEAENEIAKDVPLFVYCQSGGRSRQATALLRQMGYRNVNDIGGISGYHGKMEV